MNEVELKLRKPRRSLGGDGAGLTEEKAARYAQYLGKSADDVTVDDVLQAKSEFGQWLRKDGMTQHELKTLRTDVNGDGGFLVYPEFADYVIKDLSEISPIRQIARVRSVGSNAFRVPVRASLPSAQWLGEAAQDTLSESTYSLEEIPNGTHRATSAATREQLEDAAFNMEGEIRSDFAEQFRVNEGQAFVSGNGVKKPKGLLEDARITTVNSGNASEITYTGLVNLAHDSNINYLNASRWLLNLSTLGAIRLLEDGAGNLIYQPGIADVDSTILGFPYTIAQDMPDIAASAEPIMFGDFQRGYLIVDRVGMSMLRDPFSGKRNATVEFTAYMRVGGQVVLPNALRKQVVSA